MKKLVFVLTGLLVATVIYAQSLEEIVKNHSAAMKYDKLASITSIKITGKTSAMGMEMPMVMYMKNPNKIKVTYSINGQDMVSVFDGEKGYMINPMMGSSDPVELTGDQLASVQRNSAFKNELQDYFKSGKLTLEGQENVNDKPAFKLKASVGTNPIYMFIDKTSFLIVKTSTIVDQMGNSMNIDSYMTDYVDINDVVMPKKTKAMSDGTEVAVVSFDNIEVNIPMDDSVFKIK
jgi:outer membrane lipoprotein-sorting protein